MLLWERTYVLWACLRVILVRRLCKQEAETVQHTICRCEATARRRFNVLRDSVVEPKDIRAATVRDLCLFIRGIRLLNLH
jgi:hypothetical protein